MYFGSLRDWVHDKLPDAGTFCRTLSLLTSYAVILYREASRDILFLSDALTPFVSDCMRQIVKAVWVANLPRERQLSSHTTS